MDKNRAALTDDPVTNVLPHPAGRASAPGAASVSGVRPQAIANPDLASEVPTRIGPAPVLPRLPREEWDEATTIGPPPALPREEWDEATTIAPVRAAAAMAWPDDEATVVDRTLVDVERAIQRESASRMHRAAPPGGRFEASTSLVDRSLLASHRPAAGEPAAKAGPSGARPGVRAHEKTVIVAPPPGAKRGAFSRGPGRRNLLSLAIIVGALAFAGVASLLVVFESPARSGLPIPRPQPSSQAAAKPDTRPAPSAAPTPPATPRPVVVAGGPLAPPVAPPTKASAPKASSVAPSDRDESGNGKRSLERRAADLVARGERPAAAELYAQLAAKNPDSKAYREALRILRASTDPNSRNGQ